MPEVLLDIKQLSVSLDEGNRKILNAVDFSVPTHNICALVGGSGSGKTTLGLSVMRLLGAGLYVSGGQIIFDSQDVLSMKENDMRRLRGKSIGMVFQEPLNAFNPILKIGYQIDEVFKAHTSYSASLRKEKMYALLSHVGIPDPKRIAEQYPHQLSGGLRQRAMIAQAVAASPKLIIADEPTSNLDVTLQAKILELFLRLKKEMDLTILLITHDLGLVSHVCDYMGILNKGELVESGVPSVVLGAPKHPYTQMLLESNIL